MPAIKAQRLLRHVEADFVHQFRKAGDILPGEVLRPVHHAKAVLRIGRLHRRVAPRGDDDGGRGDGVEHFRVAEIDDAAQHRLPVQPAAQVRAVFCAIPFVRGDVGKGAAGVQKLDAALDEIDEEVCRAGIGTGHGFCAGIVFLELGLLILDRLLPHIGRIADDQIKP